MTQKSPFLIASLVVTFSLKLLLTVKVVLYYTPFFFCDYSIQKLMQSLSVGLRQQHRQRIISQQNTLILVAWATPLTSHGRKYSIQSRLEGFLKYYYIFLKIQGWLGASWMLWKKRNTCWFPNLRSTVQQEITNLNKEIKVEVPLTESNLQPMSFCSLLFHLSWIVANS